MSALRKLDHAGAIHESRSAGLPAILRALRIRKYAHDCLALGIWSLRRDVTAYDAAYVILARMLDAALVTRDTRLAKASGLGVPVLVP